MNLTNIFITYPPTAVEYTFFSSIHGALSRIGPMLGHKISLNKFKKTEIIPSIFSNHNGMKLGINKRTEIGKFTNMWKLSNILLNNEGSKKKSMEKSEKCPEANEN